MASGNIDQYFPRPMASGNIESLKVGPHDLVRLEAWSRGVDFGPRGKDFLVSPSLQQGTVTMFLSLKRPLPS